MALADENLNDVISSLIDVDEDEQESSERPNRPLNGPPVRLTERAARQIRKIRQDENLDEGLYLRVAVEGGGCSGLNYKIGFDIKESEDVDVESEGIGIVVDPQHLMYLEGVLIDYPDGLDARGFTFENPNASENCGCGSSFAV